jgi:hypothetical protein
MNRKEGEVGDGVIFGWGSEVDPGCFGLQALYVTISLLQFDDP